MNISAAAIREYKHRHGVDKLSCLTAKQFRELMEIDKGRGGYSAGKEGKKRASFHFELGAHRRDDGAFVVTLYGKHLAKNRFMAMGLGDRIRYKNAIKKAMERFWPVFRARKIGPDAPLQRSRIQYVYYNPVSRDPGANEETQKPLQDLLTRMGIIVDDRRVYIEVLPEKEVLQKEYKAVAIVMPEEMWD